MINEEKLKAIVEDWSENPYWKGEYEKAPSDRCKRAVALDWYASAVFGKDQNAYKEACAEIRKLEEQFDIDDWKHELKYCGVNPIRSKIQKKINELEAKQ